jgi:hypothetical protein
MSRIERYQESINKFISNKNILSDYIKNKLSYCNHFSGIILASILNHNSKKSSAKVHGYYMAIAIDLLYMLIDINTYPSSYEKELGSIKKNNLIIEITNLIYTLLRSNIESKYKDVKSNSVSIDELKNIFFIESYLNSKMTSISSSYEFKTVKRTNKTDILNIGTLTPKLKSKYKILYKIHNEDLLTFIESTYNEIGIIVFIIGWVLGGGVPKQLVLKSLQEIGRNFGFIYKICIDFEKIEYDLENSSKYSTNIVLNQGIHDSFTLFMELKTQLIEKCLEQNIYTNTLKEIIDLLELKIDSCIKNASIDMKSSYSSFS